MILKIIQTIFLISSQTLDLNEAKSANTNAKDSGYMFKDYIKKFSPSAIWEQIDKRRNLNGEMISTEQETEEILNGIDWTEELLRLKILPGNISEPSPADYRRYRPLPLNTTKRDPWNYRFRLYELMKQVIFDVRNKMIPMADKRKKYRKSPLYKMGFITAKADRASKLFTKVAYRSFKICNYKRFERIRNLGVVKSVMITERLLNLWFDVDLLADTIERNDINCKKILGRYSKDRKKLWKWEN